MARKPSAGSPAFPNASQDVTHAKRALDTAQTRSPSYRLAYDDAGFMLRDELRAVRLQLELLKPELLLQEREVETTIVVFGSARLPEPETARRLYAAAEAAAAAAPDDVEAGVALDRARRILARSRHYDEARRFARLVSEAGQTAADGGLTHVVATGGGPGIMEAANRGADDAGKLSIGFNIVLPTEQAPNPYITPELCFQFHYFALRKLHFLMRACALVVFPGGFGTFDELFETLTLIQTGKIAPIPVVLFDEDYWRRVVDFDEMVAEGVIAPDDLDLFVFVETAEEAWEVVRAGIRPPRA